MCIVAHPHSMCITVATATTTRLPPRLRHVHTPPPHDTRYPLPRTHGLHLHRQLTDAHMCAIAWWSNEPPKALHTCECGEATRDARSCPYHSIAPHRSHTHPCICFHIASHQPSPLRATGGCRTVEQPDPMHETAQPVGPDETAQIGAFRQTDRFV